MYGMYAPFTKQFIAELDAELERLSLDRMTDEINGLIDRESLSDDFMASEFSGYAKHRVQNTNPSGMAPKIAPKTIRDMRTRSRKPQRRVVDACLDYFEQSRGIPKQMFKTDMDTVVSAIKEKRRMGASNVSASLLRLGEGFFLYNQTRPRAALLVELDLISTAGVLVARGRLKTDERGDCPYMDVYLTGYAVLTKRNFNIHLKDDCGEQYIVYCDVEAGPFDLDEMSVPYLVIKQMRLMVTMQFGIDQSPRLPERRQPSSRKAYTSALRYRVDQQPSTSALEDKVVTLLTVGSIEDAESDYDSAYGLTGLLRRSGLITEPVLMDNRSVSLMTIDSIRGFRRAFDTVQEAAFNVARMHHEELNDLVGSRNTFSPVFRDK